MTEALNAYRLANLADCGTPDKAESFYNPDTKAYEAQTPSPGAAFLLQVQTDVVTMLSELDDYPRDLNDAAHDIADSAVPIYTHELWATFVDLAAYQEETIEYGVSFNPGDDANKLAQVALYMIAERLALKLLESSVSDSQEGE